MIIAFHDFDVLQDIIIVYIILLILISQITKDRLNIIKHIQSVIKAIKICKSKLMKNKIIKPNSMTNWII